VEVSRACASITNFDQLFIVLPEWKATAEAMASGYTPDAERDWLDPAETVNDSRTDA